MGKPSEAEETAVTVIVKPASSEEDGLRASANALPELGGDDIPVIHIGEADISKPSDPVVKRKVPTFGIDGPSSAHTLRRRVSNPAALTLFASRSTSKSSQGACISREDRQLIRQATGINQAEVLQESLSLHNTVDRKDVGHSRADNIVRNLLVVAEDRERKSSKRPSSKRPSIRPEQSSGTVTTPAPDVKTAWMEEEDNSILSKRDWLSFSIIALLSLSAVIAMCIWSEEGLLAKHGMGHIIETKTRAGHIHSRLFTTPATIALHGKEKSYFEIRLIAMSTRSFTAASHRRLNVESPGAEGFILDSLPASWRPRWRGRRWSLLEAGRRLSAVSSSAPVVGNITYELIGDDQKAFFTKTLTLRDKEEIEHFKEVNVKKLGHSNDKHLAVRVIARRSDGQEVSFLCQVLQMSAFAEYRVVLGIILFVITFIGIVSEKIHRSYCAFLGATVVICSVSAIQETPHLHTITGMIDFGTLMLLFSMMILMRMLAVTGFFSWFAVKVLIVSRQNVTILFFLLTNICGVLSMVLDNVTCVLLTGPLTFSLAKKLRINPRPLYLAMTICATVGGTATLIGDPPNIVIGLKMSIGFEKFIICNMPVVVIILPLCSLILHHRLKGMLHHREDDDGSPKKALDIEKLKMENPIVDPAGFAKLAAVLGAVLLALLLSPVHEIEPGWFTIMAMFACAILFEPHEFGKYLEFVEWDTLLFFALLFVLVEGLAELGVIRQLGDWIIAFIQVFPESSQTTMSIIIILWVSSIGSAFLESLPYTTTMVYIIIDLIRKKDEMKGFNPEILVWPLSVGACVGGIGSIMGSSANLVCIAVSKRFGEAEWEKVQGGDFLKHGLPTLFILVTIAMVWQLILFVACKYEP